VAAAKQTATAAAARADGHAQAMSAAATAVQAATKSAALAEQHALAAETTAQEKAALVRTQQ
jgi:hypothetical protein